MGIASCICDRMLLEADMLQFAPSKIAAAAVLLVRCRALTTPIVRTVSVPSDTVPGSYHRVTTSTLMDTCDMQQGVLAAPTNAVELAAFQARSPCSGWTATLQQASQYTEEEVMHCVRAIERVCFDEAADRARVYANTVCEGDNTVEGLQRALRSLVEGAQHISKGEVDYMLNVTGVVELYAQQVLAEVPHTLLFAPATVPRGVAKATVAAYEPPSSIPCSSFSSSTSSSSSFILPVTPALAHKAPNETVAAVVCGSSTGSELCASRRNAPASSISFSADARNPQYTGGGKTFTAVTNSALAPPVTFAIDDAAIGIAAGEEDPYASRIGGVPSTSTGTAGAGNMPGRPTRRAVPKAEPEAAGDVVMMKMANEAAGAYVTVDAVSLFSHICAGSATVESAPAPTPNGEEKFLIPTEGKAKGLLRNLSVSIPAIGGAGAVATFTPHADASCSAVTHTAPAQPAKQVHGTAYGAPAEVEGADDSLLLAFTAALQSKYRIHLPKRAASVSTAPAASASTTVGGGVAAAAATTDDALQMRKAVLSESNKHYTAAAYSQQRRSLPTGAARPSAIRANEYASVGVPVITSFYPPLPPLQHGSDGDPANHHHRQLSKYEWLADACIAHISKIQIFDAVRERHRHATYSKLITCCPNHSVVLANPTTAVHSAAAGADAN